MSLSRKWYTFHEMRARSYWAGARLERIKGGILLKNISIGSKNLLWQYFASYLVVMLTVMILLMVYAYNSFYLFHTQILKNNYTSNLSLVRETNETELSRLVTITGQFTAMPNMSPFVFSEEPEKAVRLTNMLGVYGASSNFARGLYLYFYNANQGKKRRESKAGASLPMI